MKKLFLVLGALLQTIYSIGQENITAQYLQNPSFELDVPKSTDAVNNTADGLRGYTLAIPSGWSVVGTNVTQLLVSKDCFTDNNFGKVTTIPDGKYAYYLRQGWSTGSTTLKQSVTLPAGVYEFSVSLRSAYANSATSVINLIASSESKSYSFNAGSNECFKNMVWQTASVTFKLNTETKVDLGFNITWQSGGSCIMLDNVKLIKLADDYTEPEDPTEGSVSSYTEGVITSDFVSEADMMQDLLQMLADFSKYMKNNWNQCSAPNSINESCGYFSGERSAASGEQGVRPNADMSMICAFLSKYAKGKVTLPAGVSWDIIDEMAMKSLIFAYSTHKANKLKVCAGNDYWGSTSTSDFVWESSLWAMSVAYSAYFQLDKLTSTQKQYIYNLLKAECNYELGRSVPTGYAGDTKAEENGWEVDVLAATLGLFPDDALASKWFERMRLFAINSYSHTDDASNTTIIDDNYSSTVASLYKGQNLYDDYTLQNHNLFHTSYQNVVMQELGEAALALQLFQGNNKKWASNALMHNNQVVMDRVLNWLALTDGELAMPNGNDWSLFLYDQITSYTTMATFLKDPNALMLENLAYKYIKARQKTTTDGSWLLRPDVAQRRMGVEAHRVMMTYLMHLTNSTADVTPTRWEDFRAQYSKAMIFPSQNIVRAFTPSRFTCFSWSNGLKSYTGYFASNSPDKNKIIVPYRANNTGNITGWYEVLGQKTDATPVVSGIYQLNGDGYVMNGELNTNGSTLNNRFAIYSTPQNAIIYLDYITSKSAVTITSEKGGLLAISTDELMKTTRTLYYEKAGEITHKQSDGSTFFKVQSDWVNIDNELGVVGINNKNIAFGDRGANNSIYTSKLYPMYSNENRSIAAGTVVDARNLVYYSLQSAVETQAAAKAIMPLRLMLPEGWNGVIAPDASYSYILISNFCGVNNEATIKGLNLNGFSPVFYQPTIITENGATVTFRTMQNNSIAQSLRFMIQGSDISANLVNDTTAYIISSANTTIKVSIAQRDNRKAALREGITLVKGEVVKVFLNSNNEVIVEKTVLPEIKDKDYTGYIQNPSFEGNSVAGWSGSPVVNNNCAEKFNTTVNVGQTITGLPHGVYRLNCQGFYRYGSYEAAAQSRSAGSEKLNAYLVCGSSKTPLCSIYDEAEKCGAIGVNVSPYGYIPNTMEQASIYFQKGFYPVSLFCIVGNDGNLPISISKTTTRTNDWCIFDNFSLTRIYPQEIIEAYMAISPECPMSEYDIDNDGQLTIADITQTIEATR